MSRSLVVNQTLRRFAGVALCAVLAACATGPKTFSSRDDGADFAAYRSYAYMTPLGTDDGKVSSLVSQYLKRATDREMAARGLRRSEGEADLLVNFDVNTAAKQRIRTSSSPSVYSRYGYYGYRYGAYRAWPGYTEVSVDDYTEGTLTVDVVDASRMQLVWEGVAVGRITEKVRSDLQGAADNAITQIFTKFPLPADGAPAQ